uniref:Small nuclear ribonucleoprotein Sm D-like protein n=1 Tax=Dermatophagoides pteronyssinus TaxID=6956 RepID=A0A6P6XYX5_DERPT|nr:small nuclear ribonucleoprotein Sm D-like protein [Dermatophagoides pteronyssinus]
MDSNPDSEQNCDKIEISLDQSDFDPELVLFGDVSVKIPVPEAKIFNNLDEYYKSSFQKKMSIQESKNQPKKPANLYERNVEFFYQKQDESTTTETTSRNRRSRELTDVIKKMEQSQKGPLSLLYQSMDKIIKILIRRRRKSCLLREEKFSWLTGRLIAFDKHFNLVIEDAIETYHHQRQQIKSSTIDNKSTNNSIQIQIINKQSRQLLIRGDNIVMIVRQKEE